MSSEIISRLPRLREDSGVRISTSVIYGANATENTQLISMDLRNGDWVGIPRDGASTLHFKQNLVTLTSRRSGYMRALNQSLKGGSSHPILLAALGTVTGSLFAVATLAIDLSRRDSDVLARRGDEIWAVEEIGKVYESNWFSEDGWVAQHITSYFLYDPYRRNGIPEKGWLLHESRTNLVFD